MSAPAREQKMIKIRVRIPNSAVRPETYNAIRALRPNPALGRIIVSAVGVIVLAVALLVSAVKRDAPIDAGDADGVDVSTVAPQQPRRELPEVATVQPPAAIDSAPHATARLDHVANRLTTQLTSERQTGDNRVVRALITDTVRSALPGAALRGTAPATDVTQKFYFFTELENPAGKRFAHVWEYNGKTVARIEFKPRTNPWRALSSKKFAAHMTGQWRAVLLNEHGAELTSVPLEYTAQAGL